MYFTDERLRRLKDKANKLPLTPGVYIMRSADKKIIYIGKAKALKNRVSQYFGAQDKHLPKVRKMVENVEDFDYILTDSEFEALVLECSLIKQHMPKYNILLKDDKGYSYIKISPAPWQNITACFKVTDDGSQYLGPYTAGFSVNQAVDETKRIYKLPTCSKVFPRDIGKSRPCLNFFLGLCSAPCAKKITEAQYAANFSEALKFLKVGSQATLKDLQNEMEKASENLEFEKAARLRDTIKSIEKVGSRQKVVSATYPEEDVTALAVADGKACFSVLSFRESKLTDSEYFITEETDTPENMRSAFITAYYSMRRAVPRRVVVDGDTENNDTLEAWLSEKRGTAVSIVIPQRGEQLKLVEMCHNNATQKLLEKYVGSRKTEDMLEELALLLGLPGKPSYIEAYDISHTGGSDNVAGMVVFENGKPLRAAYRHFAIKGFSGQDDYRSMAEVLERRFTEYKKHCEAGETDGFARMPDLILLDGGRGQVNAVAPVLEKMGVNVPLFGMVKDSAHRTSAIATGGGKIEFSSKRAAFTFVTNVQDEVHRFAIGYHRKKHAKSILNGTLTTVKGVGDKKAAALLKEFKTVKGIADATESELCRVNGITPELAKAIHEALRT